MTHFFHEIHQRTRARLQEAQTSQPTNASRTLTITRNRAPLILQEGTYLLRSQRMERRVTWSSEIRDNENDNKRKSNVCCIFHRRKKARDFSDNSDDSDEFCNDSDENPGLNAYEQTLLPDFCVCNGHSRILYRYSRDGKVIQHWDEYTLSIIADKFIAEDDTIFKKLSAICDSFDGKRGVPVCRKLIGATPITENNLSNALALANRECSFLSPVSLRHSDGYYRCSSYAYPIFDRQIENNLNDYRCNDGYELWCRYLGLSDHISSNFNNTVHVSIPSESDLKHQVEITNIVTVFSADGSKSNIPKWCKPIIPLNASDTSLGILILIQESCSSVSSNSVESPFSSLIKQNICPDGTMPLMVSQLAGCWAQYNPSNNSSVLSGEPLNSTLCPDPSFPIPLCSYYFLQSSALN